MMKFQIHNAGGAAPDMTPRQGFQMTINDYDYIMELNLRAYATIFEQKVSRRPIQHNISNKSSKRTSCQVERRDRRCFEHSCTSTRGMMN